MIVDHHCSYLVVSVLIIILLIIFQFLSVNVFCNVVFYCVLQGAFPEAYETVSDVLASCQLAAFLEVIHPIFGIVKTGLMAPFMQVD